VTLQVLNLYPQRYPATSQAYGLGTERGTSSGKMLMDKPLLLKLPNTGNYSILIYLE
jgi:hypothetical protein